MAHRHQNVASVQCSTVKGFQHKKMVAVEATESAAYAVSESHNEMNYNKQFDRMMAMKSKTRKCEHVKGKLKDQYKDAK